MSNASKFARAAASAIRVLCLGAAALTPAHVSSQSFEDATDVKAAAPAPSPSWASWFDQSRLPFIPVPVVAVDPDSGTTLGVLPVWLHTNEHHEITRITAPDILHNPNFGLGIHARVFEYPSPDEQWSVVAAMFQHVQRGVDVEYQIGRLRANRWSINASLIYDRNAARRFHGIGNDTEKGAETNYTDEKRLAQAEIGFNLNHDWQLLYTLRIRSGNVRPGILKDIVSIESRFPGALGSESLLVNRVAVVYDSRDDATAPSTGMKWVAYGGLASRGGAFNASMYSEAGVDVRGFWPIQKKTIIAAHASLRYLPSVNQVPFWALSNLGGDDSEIGGPQPLRGFGAGRYYDRNAFSASLEVRKTVFSFDAASTHVDIEFTPFADVGRVFAHGNTFPLSGLHRVGGVGFRAIARPFVVGYVDIGYGTDGVAAFTSINYPF